MSSYISFSYLFRVSGDNLLYEQSPKMNQVQQSLTGIPPAHQRLNESRAKVRISGTRRRIRGSSVHGRGLRVKESRVNVIRVDGLRGLLSRRIMSRVSGLRVKALVAILSLPNR